MAQSKWISSHPIFDTLLLLLRGVLSQLSAEASVKWFSTPNIHLCPFQPRENARGLLMLDFSSTEGRPSSALLLL